ncbi:hypothetical protein [Streptomyces sp. RK75]|uniref:hypothetical protein n=1 Tax=Streptomyces sp. RK75 TaxID=2824895 RepID=UPI001B3719E3|nr:hypothetical protein [Streptomyces sp. RK75]MBQ0868486.1 hypothetical protein [Streptomyces sp. RK75]
MDIYTFARLDEQRDAIGRLGDALSWDDDPDDSPKSAAVKTAVIGTTEAPHHPGTGPLTCGAACRIRTDDLLFTRFGQAPGEYGDSISAR